MKKSVAISFFTFSFSLYIFSQTISTVAGNHSYGGSYSGDGGTATSAGIFNPYGVGTDTSGNLYIADRCNNVIRKVNTSGIINTVAGNNSYGSGYSGDGGPATLAELYDPAAVAIDAYGNLYIADAFNSVVRMVNTLGIISTFAGNHISSYSGDGGPATAAELFDPYGLVFDASDNLYIADDNDNVIRKVNTSGIINTVAGNYAYNPGGGYSGDGGPATAAELQYPEGIVFDALGNLYIGDMGNNVIRMVNTLGVISTIAGNHSYLSGYSGDGGPATIAELTEPEGIAVDASGNLYIADWYNNVIRKVNTSGIINAVAGNYLYSYLSGGYSGDGGAATAAEIHGPDGITFDASGNLYIADELNNVIRKVSNLDASIVQLPYESGQIIVYPNPATGKFTINIVETPCMASLLTVYNIMWERIFVKTMPLTAKGSLNTIDLSSQASGVYLYKIADENGKLIGQGKLVIQR